MTGNPNYPKGAGGKPVALEARDTDTDGRRFSPSVARNRDVLREAFMALVPGARHVLEIASGTGEHGVHIARGAPGLNWTFSDPDADSRGSIAAWMEHGDAARLHGPLDVDTTRSKWIANAPAGVDTIVCINMIHIAPWAAAEGLIAGAGSLLPKGRRLFFYGPFARNGEMVESNRAFDASLKSRNPDWGVRDLDLEVVPLAENAGFVLAGVREMPANNLSVVFERKG